MLQRYVVKRIYLVDKLRGIYPELQILQLGVYLLFDLVDSTGSRGGYDTGYRRGFIMN